MILNTLKEIDNKQLYNFTRELIQMLLTSKLRYISYKLWSSETIQKWSNLQEQVKSTDKDLSPRQLSYLWRSL